MKNCQQMSLSDENKIGRELHIKKSQISFTINGIIDRSRTYFSKELKQFKFIKMRDDVSRIHKFIR